MNNNELKIVLPKGWSVSEKVMSDGSRVLSIKQEHVFVKIRASELSLEDRFMKYTPRTKVESIFKENVEETIKEGLKDFWRPIYAPSFDDNGRICYEPGKEPAVDKSYI